MRRRAVLTGLAGLGAAAVADAVAAPAPPSVAAARGSTGPLRAAWPATGAGAARTAVTFRVRTAARAVALTFDDGPDPHWTPRVLEVLARHDATATFFVVGERARRHPALLRRIAAAGHVVGNHTDRHAKLSALSPPAVVAELARANASIADILGAPPDLFRPPYGHLDAAVLLAAAQAGLEVVLWSQLIRGSAAEADADTCLREVRPGSIVLAHDGGPTPTEALLRALDRFLGAVRADGYAGVDVPALLHSATPA